MFDWVVNLLLVEAGVFLISMAGCFVAGICLEARELRREARIERLAREVSEMGDLELLREVSHDKYPKDIVLNELRKRQKEKDKRLLAQEPKPASTTRDYGAFNLLSSGMMTTNDAREILKQFAGINVDLSDSTTFYSNNVAYFEMHPESLRPQLDNLKRAIEEMSERIEKSE